MPQELLHNRQVLAASLERLMGKGMPQPVR